MGQPEETRDEEKVTSAAWRRRAAVPHRDSHGGHWRRQADRGIQDRSLVCWTAFDMKSDYKFGSLLIHVLGICEPACSCIAWHHTPLPNARTPKRQGEEKGRPTDMREACTLEKE